MVATVHALFPDPPASRAPAAPSPLAVALRERCLSLLDELAGRMFDKADDTLFEMSERAQTDTERRGYFDTLRVLRLNRTAVSRSFLERLSMGFDGRVSVPKPPPGDEEAELSIQSTEALEERIALGNLASKVEGRCKDQLYQLGLRLQAAREQGVAIPVDVLSPGRICEAFGAAAAALQTSFEIKLVLYKLFDRLLSSHLGQVYQAALDVLAHHGGALPQAVARPAVPATSIPASAALGRLQQQGLDPDRLRSLGDSGAAHLTAALQACLDGGRSQAAEATRRVTMAGHLFDALFDEAYLGLPLREALEPLRHPLSRAALADPGLFADATHPLRRALTELVDLAAATRTGEASTARFRTALATVIAQAEARARQPVPVARHAALDEDHLVETLRSQAEARRQVLLRRVRQLVAEELALRMAGRVLPAAVQRLLRSGFGPLLALRLLRDGRGGAGYRAAEALLDDVLASLEAGASTGASAPEALIADLRTRLREVGLAEARLDDLIGGLRDAHRDRQAPASPTPAAPETRPTVDAVALVAPDGDHDRLAQIAPIMVPQAWFRVFDPAAAATRWLRLVAFHPAQDRVCFDGFDEAAHLSLRAGRFAEDLARGRSEPINPGAAARAALEALRQA